MSGISARTAIEYAAVIGALVVFLGGGKLPGSDTKTSAPISAAHVSQDKVSTLIYPERDLKCPEHPLDVRIFSSNPLILYIDNFLSVEESRHLLELSEGQWKPSTIFNEGREELDDTVRKSDRAKIERDQTVQCIEMRALTLQGWPEHTFVERLWTQRYTRGGHYSLHYDWASSDPYAHRSSSFMVYVDANCTGGGTHFPLLSKPKDTRWCGSIDCSDDAAAEGVTFLPKPRAAVFWQNFDGEGKGWRESVHAGMPVTEGVKVGLNIWSWYQAGLTPESLRQEA